MPRRTIQFAVSVFLCISVAGCIRSKKPLSDPDQSIQDSSLYGTWVTRKASGETELMVIGGLSEASNRKDLPGGLMRAVMSSLSGNNTVSSPSEETFFVSFIGLDRYMNIFSTDILNSNTHPAWESRTIEQFRLVKYRVTGDTLEVWRGSESALGEMIERRQVRGDVTRDEKSRTFRTAILSDSTENLVRFFRGPGKPRGIS